MRHAKTLIILVAFLVQGSFVLSQEQVEEDSNGRLSSRFDLSYMFGGQFYNDHFVYDPGVSVQFTQSYRVTESFEAGLGTGYISLMNENFIPIYLEAFAYKKNKSNTPVIRFQAGAVVAWFNTANYPTDYSMDGILFFSAGMGRKISLKNRYSILFQWSITHITARISYPIFGSQDYASLANYDMLQLSFGILRN